MSAFTVLHGLIRATPKGRYDLKLLRMDIEEEEGVNPWRIKVQNVRLDWQDKSGD